MDLPPNPFPDPILSDLSRRFSFHADIYQGASPENASPLYAHLSRAVASDPDILDLVRDADRSTQITHLLFGAVHFLLLGGVQHPLAGFYASLTPAPHPPDQAYPDFRSFCLEHAAEIRQLATTRRVQTNEVQRCTGLLPAFFLASQRHKDHSLALVEIGASAGLLLLWDRYGYEYPGAGRRGDPRSPVQLVCNLVGPNSPPIPRAFPLLVTRIGIDINPVDVRDPLATRWLRALIWPEHRDRARLFEQAVIIARQDPPAIVAGNAADLLPEVLGGLPQDAIACVYHSYALNQCPPAVREQILDRLQTFARTRPLVRVSLEWYDGQEQPHLEMYTYIGGDQKQDLLALCESHGRAIEWLYPHG